MEISETIFQVMIFLLSKKLKEFENQVFLSEKKTSFTFFTPRTIRELLKPFDETT